MRAANLNLQNSTTRFDYYAHYKQILQLCIEKEASKEARSVHAHVLTNGFASNLHLNTKLIIFYSKFRDVMSARKVFDRMPERSIVSWTSLISGYTQNGNYGDALLVFSGMQSAGIRSNQFTYGSLLRSCTGLRCLSAGLQIHGCVQKSRFFGNLVVQSALVDFHSKCGLMKDAWYLFANMSERDLVSWNVMVGGYAAQGFVDNTFQMLQSMVREGVSPDWFTLGSVLKASSRASHLTSVCQIHGFIIKIGLGSHMALIGSLIDAYAKCKSIRNADRLYRSMPEKDIICCTALITGYACNRDNSNEALVLFKEIKQMHLHIDNVILSSILSICANVPSLFMGTQIHALSLKYKSSYDVALGNALVDMYAKSGEIGDANRVFDEMEEKNVISWTSLISGYANNGYGKEAIALYKKMESSGLTPNEITFLSLLSACSHSGLVVEGWELFNNMINKYNIPPRSEHFSCVVDLFARKGQLEEAYNMTCRITKPNAALWGAILGACRVHGNISLGEKAGMQLLNMDPKNSVNYVTLASIYAAAGTWDSSSKMRSLMEKRSLKKAPAYSLVDATKKNIALL